MDVWCYQELQREKNTTGMEGCMSVKIEGKEIDGREGK